MAPTGYRTVSRGDGLARMRDEQVAEFAKSGCAFATEYLLDKYRGFVECKARSYFLAGAEQEAVEEAVKEELSQPAAEPIKHNPEGETNKEGYLYSQKRKMTTKDRVLERISNFK